MKTEIEVKFLSVDIDTIRARLVAIGAICEHPMRLMRRALIEEPHHKADNSFLRIRDEGDKATMTFKRRANPDAPTIDGVKEIEVVVSSFDDTLGLLREAGWDYVTFQESRRETWRLDNTEIAIDEWPWIDPYIEIEGTDEAAVQVAARKLDLEWKEAEYGHIDYVYGRRYAFAPGCRGVIDIKEVRFRDPLPDVFTPLS